MPLLRTLTLKLKMRLAISSSPTSPASTFEVVSRHQRTDSFLSEERGGSDNVAAGKGERRSKFREEFGVGGNEVSMHLSVTMLWLILDAIDVTDLTHFIHPSQYKSYNPPLTTLRLV